MSDEITALLSDQYYEPDSAEAMAMAQQLRGNLNDANFLSMSSVKPVAQMGNNMRQTTLGAAETRGGLNRAIAAERRKQEQLIAQEGRADERLQATEKRALTRTMGAEDRAREKELENKEDLNFWHPTLEGKVLNLERSPNGTYYDQAGELYPPEIVATLTPYKAPLTGSTQQKVGVQKFNKEKEDNYEKLISDGAFVSNTLQSNLMQAATGKWYDPVKQIGNLTGILPEVQSQGNKLAQLTATAAAPMLDTLGINPTDNDVKVAFNTVPQDANEPLVWLEWYQERYAPALLRDIARGSKPELAPIMQRKIDETVAAMKANMAANKKGDKLDPPEFRDKTPVSQKTPPKNRFEGFNAVEVN